MSDLSDLHNSMDKEADKRRGWARFFGHFVIFAGIPQLAACIAYEFGVGIKYFIATPWLLIPAGWMCIYVYEFQDYVRHRNGKHKAYLDFLSKGLGWTVGVATWLVWWV